MTGNGNFSKCEFLTQFTQQQKCKTPILLKVQSNVLQTIVWCSKQTPSTQNKGSVFRITTATHTTVQPCHALRKKQNKIKQFYLLMWQSNVIFPISSSKYIEAPTLFPECDVFRGVFVFDSFRTMAFPTWPNRLRYLSNVMKNS